MRKVMLLAALAAACTKEAPKTDTAAPAAVTPAAPANLTAADIAGTWKGTSRMEASDSVVNRWTAMNVNDSTSRIVIEGSKDTVTTKMMVSGDSMVGTSAPYVDPAFAKAGKVKFVAVGRLKDGKLVGTTTVKLAKNDSVLARTRWEATKAP